MDEFYLFPEIYLYNLNPCSELIGFEETRDGNRNAIEVDGKRTRWLFTIYHKFPEIPVGM